MSYRYHALGLDLTAAFPCPGLAAGDARAPRRPVEIVLAAVPPVLDTPILTLPLTTLDRQGRCLHHVPGVARYLVVSRERVVIDIAPGASVARALRFLRFQPLAVVCRLWGLVPLTLACVAMDAGAVLIAGGAAAGKSSLAAALLRDGGRLVADGLCALDASDPAMPCIWPGFAELGLWADSMRGLDWPVPPGGPGPGGRYALDVSSRFEPGPQPIRAVIRVVPALDGAADEMHPLSPRQCFVMLMNAAPVLAHLRALPGAQAGLAAVARLASSLPGFEFHRRDGFDDLGGRVLRLGLSAVCGVMPQTRKPR